MSGENLEFKWGKKKAVGKNKGVQFYASFEYDGVEYELYDCVYMWKDGEEEPFVGKIVKIWEDKSKKVKIIWFFKPVEISNYLGQTQTIEKELFLACGEGLGLANLNPLEAIAGKCNVLCISKDERNPQPTKEELQAADYVFYRVFDVGKLTVSETMPDNIAGIDITDFLNRRKDQQASVTYTVGTKNLRDDVPLSQTENGDKANSRKPSEVKIKAEEKVDTVSNRKLQDKDDDDRLDSRPSKKPRLDSFVNVPKEKDYNDQKLNVHVDGTSSRRPDAVDRSRWFKELPWEERMENAHRQGALVLLENLDPSYSSADVEDIIWQGFKESCTARIVYHATNRRFSGQAFVVFKTKEVAEKVVLKLEQGCLMLSNGRPLIASFRNPCFPGKETIVGHFGIDKVLVQSSRDKKEVVSTSHCSQPNSIEYEFAMEWCLLQERLNWGWRKLHKEQDEEVKKLMAELKTKLT